MNFYEILYRYNKRNIYKNINYNLVFIILIIISICSCSTVYRPNKQSSGSLFYNPPNNINIGFLTIDNNTDNHFKQDWANFGPFDIEKNPNLFLTDIIINEIKSKGLFKSIEKTNIFSSNFSENIQLLAKKYDAVFVGELYNYKAGGGPYLTNFINPLILGVYIGAPIAKGYFKGDIQYCLKLVDLKTKKILWNSGKKTIYFNEENIRSSAYNLIRLWKEYNNKLVEKFVDDICDSLVEETNKNTIMANYNNYNMISMNKEKNYSNTKDSLLIKKDNSYNSMEYWAVIIGISNYQDSKIPSLRYAAADANIFYKWIISPKGGKYAPSRVKLMINNEATNTNIKKALFGWLKQVLEEDMVVIYFAGHGSPDTPSASNSNNNNLFLLPYDTQYENIASTSFPMWDIETALKRFIKAKKVIVIADACHSGGVGKSFDIARRDGRAVKVNKISTGLQNLAQISEGIVVISASNDNQFSSEGTQWGGGHGVFTYFLLKGLIGSSDYNKDGKVTLGEIIPYVSEQVRRSTNNEQCPIITGQFDPSISIAK